MLPATAVTGQQLNDAISPDAVSQTASLAPLLLRAIFLESRSSFANQETISNPSREILWVEQEKLSLISPGLGETLLGLKVCGIMT